MCVFARIDKENLFIMANENLKIAGELTEQQVNDSANNIVRPIKENSLPQLKLQNNGAYVKLTKEEIVASCSSVYEGIL